MYNKNMIVPSDLQIGDYWLRNHTGMSVAAQYCSDVHKIRRKKSTCPAGPSIPTSREIRT